MQKPLIILGIDPGTVILGYSIIEASGSSIQVKAIDCLKLSSKKDNYQKLELIYNHILQIIEQFAPDEFAIEAPFFGKNVQSMLKLGRAQGVAIAAAMTRHIPVTEYSPKKVKQSITGNGNADKEQIWKMLQKITYLPDKPKYFDATDALAVAICHHFNNKVPELNSGPVAKKVKADGWEKFIKQNPGRIYK